MDDRTPVTSIGIAGSPPINGDILIVGATLSGQTLTIPAGASGTVTNVSSADANATVANPTTTPAITIVSAPKLQNARTIAGKSFDGTGNITIASTDLSDAATIAAFTATKLLTARTIAGKSFDGTGNITIASTDLSDTASIALLTSVQALTNKDLTSGTNTFPTLNQNTTGSAAKLTTARNIAGKSFDGTGDITIASTDLSNTANIVLDTNTITLTNKRITQRVLALSANSATPAINTDSYDVVHITSQTAAITSFTTNLTGTPVDGDTLRISVTGTGAVALTFGTSFEASTVALPTTTASTTRLDFSFIWNTETTKWRCVGVV